MRLYALAVLLGAAACGRLDIDPIVGDGGGTSDALIDIVIDTNRTAFDVFVAAGTPVTPVAIRVTVEPGVLVGAPNAATPAFTTGALAGGSSVTLINDGEIIGAGGDGGSGGNGGSGGTGTLPYCGRPGAAGGIAIAATVAMTITNNGLIAGGGGGGGGMSACNETAGGGGGAGSVAGAGGAGASATMQQEIAYCGQDNGYRVGAMGSPGMLMTGGPGGVTSATTRGGDGGDLGQPGTEGSSCVSGSGSPGAAGFAIRHGASVITGIDDGSYSSGSGPVRGPVGP